MERLSEEQVKDQYGENEMDQIVEIDTSERSSEEQVKDQ